MEHRSDVFENSSFNYATMILTLTRQSATHEATVVVPALGKYPEQTHAPWLHLMQVQKQGA
jgi:hypothetical protein